jgi:ATP-dependent DNA helicase PIF1
LLSKITTEHKTIYETIVETVNKEMGGLFFLCGYGGIRKNFLWRAITATIRSQGEIFLTVDSSGIAALLIPGGRTAHSRFSIPINVNEDSTCNIKQGSPLVERIIKAKLIIWDEAPMCHRHAFEALDKSM